MKIGWERTASNEIADVDAELGFWLRLKRPTVTMTANDTECRIVDCRAKIQ
jgi:hypothetical protein